MIAFGFDSCHYWYQMNCEKQANSILAVRIRAETGNIDSPHLGVFQGSSLKTMYSTEHPGNVGRDYIALRISTAAAVRYKFSSFDAFPTNILASAMETYRTLMRVGFFKMNSLIAVISDSFRLLLAYSTVCNPEGLPTASPSRIALPARSCPFFFLHRHQLQSNQIHHGGNSPSQCSCKQWH